MATSRPRYPLVLLSSLAMTAHALPSLSARDDAACSSDGPLSCPKNAACISLAGETTVLCCPSGSECDNIRPIVCDVSQQDGEKFPGAPIKTSVFDVDLETCGGGCCPFGYSCSGGSGSNQCIRDEDQSKSPKPSAPVTISPSATSQPRTSPSSTSTSASQASSTAEPEESSGTPKPKLTSIIGGIVGGCLVLLILSVILLLYLRRRRRNQLSAAGYTSSTEKPHRSHSRNASNSSSSARHLNISEPIVQAEPYRTDFILKSPSAASSISNRPPQQQHRRSRLSIPNPFSSARSPTAASQASFTSTDERSAKTGVVAATRLPPIRSMKASSRYSRRTSTKRYTHTPPAEGENIDVFADPTTVAGGSADHRVTTFSDMMAQADLAGVHRGEKTFVPGTTPRI